MSWFKKHKEATDITQIEAYLKSLNIYMDELSASIIKTFTVVNDLNSRMSGLRESIYKINNRQMDQDDSIKKLGLEMRRRADKGDDVIAKYEQVLEKVKFTEIIHQAAKSEKKFLKAQKNAKPKVVVPETPRVKRKYTKRAK